MSNEDRIEDGPSVDGGRRQETDEGIGAGDHSLATVVSTGTGASDQRRYDLARSEVSQAVLDELAKPPMITVRGDILAPLLVYMRKFFQCVQQHNANGMSRFMEPGDFQLNVALQGFTPEDWNAMMSLARSAGADLEEVLDRMAGNTPQMARPELRRRGGGLPPIRDAKQEINRLNAKMGVAEVTEKALEARKEE